eukprot:764478-Hanusia_phi.AAC.2
MQTRWREHEAMLAAVLREVNDIHAETCDEIKRMRMWRLEERTYQRTGGAELNLLRSEGGGGEEEGERLEEEERELLVQKLRDYKELTGLLERGMEHMRRKHEAAVRQLKSTALQHAQQVRRMMESMLQLVRSGQVQHLDSLDVQTLASMIGGDNLEARE